MANSFDQRPPSGSHQWGVCQSQETNEIDMNLKGCGQTFVFRGLISAQPGQTSHPITRVAKRWPWLAREPSQFRILKATFGLDQSQS